MNFDPKQHWEKVYQEKNPEQVSWYKADPTVSLELIVSFGVNPNAKVIDVGGGASVLVDRLLEKGFKDLTVLDISAKAFEYAKERLKGQAQKIVWVESDITKFEPQEKYDLWHDWAVFHFLTDPADRRKYIGVLEKTVKSNGHVIIATFALEGPLKCSGLNVERYDSAKLSKELGSQFILLKTVSETHVTPWDSKQKFSYCIFRKK